MTDERPRGAIHRVGSVRLVDGHYILDGWVIAKPPGVSDDDPIPTIELLLDEEGNTMPAFFRWPISELEELASEMGEGWLVRPFTSEPISQHHLAQRAADAMFKMGMRMPASADPETSEQ